MVVVAASVVDEIVDIIAIPILLLTKTLLVLLLLLLLLIVLLLLLLLQLFWSLCYCCFCSCSVGFTAVVYEVQCSTSDISTPDISTLRLYRHFLPIEMGSLNYISHSAYIVTPHISTVWSWPEGVNISEVDCN